MKWNDKIYESRGTYGTRLLVDFSFYKKKVKFKVPLSRGSHFKIHFSLEFWGNRGSSQNFHGAPFSGDRKIIISSHTTISISYYTYSKHEIWHMHGQKHKHEELLYSYQNM